MNTPKRKSQKKHEEATPSTAGDFDELNEIGEDEHLLLKFDMDYRFGPCRGVTRAQRLERALANNVAGTADYERVVALAKGEHARSVFDQRLKGGL